MKAALTTIGIGLGWLMMCGSAWAQAEPTVNTKLVHVAKSRINAALMLSAGESPSCQTGNISSVYVVIISTSNKPSVSRHISSSEVQGCAVLPITLAKGTQLTITGVLQDTAAIPGGSISDSTISVTEGCFNVEAFALGLTGSSSSEYDPSSSANIVNTQGFGFAWYDSDQDLKPGPYSYTVTGCAGGCSTATSYYNTDSLTGPPTACSVLSPFPAVAQTE